MEKSEQLHSRREVLKAGAAAIAIQFVTSCGSRDAIDTTKVPEKKKEPNIKTFDQLESFCREQFGDDVVAAEQNGPRTVVFLGDIHVKTIEQLNMKRLTALEENWDVQIVGDEGVVKHPKHSEHEEVEQYVAQVMKISPDEVLQFQNANAEDAQTITLPEWADYRDLYEDERFATLGLERKDLAPLVAFGAQAESSIDVFMEVVGRGYMPLRRGSKTEQNTLLLLKIQNELKGDKLFPQFDLEKLHTKKEGTYILGPEDNQLVGMTAVQFLTWRDKRVNSTRNTVAIDILAYEMEKRDFERAAMIFGRAHGKKSQFHPEGPTMQEEMERRKLSYIYIDPQAGQ